ncbi:hypothetical protein DACRYDRAFT_93402 [Dacryopinax primogenitus]|uniref:HRQ family protein 1 n=1 Tax=Dacryopinax primogenitus (strain DJM 731) TaxID=1858805 RepID=M5G448_DACPD|nr:uncharacterized protein DACRYDRAFT_93402 [Dacryopinax primogenitus]EJU05041.1 hypothetical protein DACRYDRAFT_93402 [Dacryopinax primogenitus]
MDMYILVLAGLCALCGIFGMWSKRRALKDQLPSKTITKARDVKLRDEMDREPGEWRPVAFDYPKFKPWHDFDIDRTLPPLYRPFRWGPYHLKVDSVTMGLRNMSWPEWIELDNRYQEYHTIRAERMRTRGSKAVRTMPPRDGVPGGADAAREVVHELAEYLSRRYPMMFRVERKQKREGDWGWYGDGEIRTIEILPLGEVHDLDKEDPMTVAGLLVQDDLFITLEGRDGKYYFQAGSICTGGFWRMEDKIGKALDDIHRGGNVPQYDTKLQPSLTRFFRKLQTDKPVLRNNYFIQIDRALAWSEPTNGAEDAFDEGTHEPNRELRGDFSPPEPTVDVRTVHFRTERQSLRRMPRTGAVLFTVRTYIEPVTKLVEEPGVPGRLASAVRGFPEDIFVYKAAHLYRDALLPFLDEAHRRQVEQGVIKEGDETSAYPY